MLSAKKNKQNTTVYIFFKYKNMEVTRDYLNVIGAALHQVDLSCQYVNTMDGVPKKAFVMFVAGVDAFKYYLQGYHNIILWQQGATGAESFMRNSSKLRRAVLNHMDCFLMKKAKMIFYVSEYMLEYYERMAKKSFRQKAYVMPCFNEELDEEVLASKDYSRKIFTYVGSLDVWQCFDETASIYEQIEKRIPDAFFKVLTFHTEKAEQIIQQHNIRNYSVACVPKEQVKSELENATYGFIIRHDIDVNRVATPTKISSYLSAGVLPIYSTSLKDFHAHAEQKKFAYALEPDGDIQGLLDYVNNGVNKEIVNREIKDLFSTYYSKDVHIRNITDILNVRLK